MYFIWLFVLSMHLALKQVDASDLEYDEVEKFNEVLQLENPLVVLFSEECCKCTDCVEAEVLLGGLSQQLEEDLGVFVIRLKKPDLRSQYAVKHVPALVYIRKNKTAHYNGEFEMDSLYSWLQENIDPLTVDLDDKSFEHLTQASTGATTGDWLVLFHDGSCCKKKELIFLENAGINLRNKVNVASVNTNNSPDTAERFHIRNCPTIVFFRHQRMYRFSLTDVNTASLVRFSMGFYKNSKAENVPVPPSAFDKFTDKFVENLKIFINDHWYTLLIGLALTTVFTTTMLVCIILLPSFTHVKKE